MNFACVSSGASMVSQIGSLLYVKLIAAGIIVLAALSVPIAAMIPKSQLKRRFRLAGSLLLGIGLVVASVGEMIQSGRLLPEGILTAGGVFLVYVGVRKYRRDPEGRTAPAQIL